MPDALEIVIAIAAIIIVIALLIWKNKKDKKQVNPDAQDSVNETIMDHKRRRDKI